jgi:hypothetical protein
MYLCIILIFKYFIIKKYTKFLPFLLLGLCLVLNSCSSESEIIDQETESNDLKFAKSSSFVASNQSNQKILDLLEDTFLQRLQNIELTNEQLGNYFEEHLENREIETVDTSIDKTEPYIQFNQLELNYISFIKNDIFNHNTPSDYIMSLTAKKESLKKDGNITDSHKAVIIDYFTFQIDFVNWMEYIDLQYNDIETQSWWDDWGRCAASIIGGALTGGVGACVGGAGVGAIIGAAATFWTGVFGFAGAAGGAIVGCIAGGVAGAIGGGLTGAVTGC